MSLAADGEGNIHAVWGVGRLFKDSSQTRGEIWHSVVRWRGPGEGRWTRCPFSAEDLAAAGFETLVRDGVDDKAARALGAALGWDKTPDNMNLEDDLFAPVTVARKKPLAGRG
jgi:hypothetical protein